jgi:hypothetical protein
MPSFNRSKNGLNWKKGRWMGSIQVYKRTILGHVFSRPPLQIYKITCTEYCLIFPFGKDTLHWHSICWKMILSKVIAERCSCHLVHCLHSTLACTFAKFCLVFFLSTYARFLLSQQFMFRISYTSGGQLAEGPSYWLHRAGCARQQRKEWKK